MTTSAYNHRAIEKRWQDGWRATSCFQTPAQDARKQDCFVYAAPPFTTGRLHLGHVRSYAIADAYARYRRARGDAVLFSIGFDSFGLPNEIAASEHGMAPRQWVDRCMQGMKDQFERLGCGFDWERSYDSSHPDLFRWSQWAFLKLYENDFVFRSRGVEHWCDNCQSVLAAMQTSDGRCWRCDSETRFVQVPQWYLRLSALAEELDESLDQLTGWDPKIVNEQRDLLGRMEGYEVILHDACDEAIPVFAVQKDFVHEATFVAISADHPYYQCLTNRKGEAANFDELGKIPQNRQERDVDRMAAIKLNQTVGLLDSNKTLPVVVSPHYSQKYGSAAAVFGVPSRNRSDRIIADRLGLHRQWEVDIAESSFKPTVRYRCRDFSISRSRSWGAPIPIVVCESCGDVPIAESELPVTSPATDSSDAKGSGQRIVMRMPEMWNKRKA